MATSALDSINVYTNKFQKTSTQDYKNMISDILCRSPETGTRNQCFQFLNSLGGKNSSRTDFFMNSKYGQLDANFEGHEGVSNCVKVDGKDDLECSVTVPSREKPTDTLAREFEAYNLGFNLLKKLSAETY